MTRDRYARAFEQVAQVVQGIPAVVNSVEGALGRTGLIRGGITRNPSSSARELGRQYERTHGGHRGRLEDVHSYPDASSGLIELGSLDAIAYWTRKGQRIERFVHDFGYREGDELVDAQPVLCFAADGSGLVIARGRSRYRITSRGIEG